VTVFEREQIMSTERKRVDFLSEIGE